LLTLHVTLAVLSLTRENPTVDEVVHLPAGITYWQKGTFRLYPHNPPLVKLVAALPVLAMSPALPYGEDSWRVDPPNKAAFAHEFMRDNAENYFALFARARLLMPVFSVVGGLVVFIWSKSLYGPAGGLLSLVLWALCPNILAHTRLVTTDLGATSFGALATFLFWRYLKRPTWRRAVAAGILLGLAQLTKFSLLVLYGLWPVLAVFRLATSGDWRRLALPMTLHALLVLALSVLVIDVGYAFEGVGIPLGDYEFTCQTLTRPVPPGVQRPRHHDPLLDGAYHYRINRFRGTWLGRLPVPLPRYYLLGFDYQKIEAEGIPNRFFLFHEGGEAQVREAGAAAGELMGYPVYLDGELRQSSWWYYYLLTLVYKVPEGTWVLVLASLAVLALSPRSRASRFDEFAVLAVPAFVLFVMSVFTNINLGLRYVLPIFPYVYVSVGKLAPWALGLPTAAARRAAGAFIGACLAATATSTALIHPHYLAYFNAVSGGPDRGAEHLIDSNIDWGQDLVNLRDWLRQNAPGERVGLAYFGQIHPKIFDARGEGFAWYLPPPTPGTMRVLPARLQADPEAWKLRPGLYAVSASLVKGLPWRVYDSPWEFLGKRYGTGWGGWQAWIDAFGYFRRLEPVHKIGYSIWIYRLTSEQAARLNRIWEHAPGLPRAVPSG
jgi:hypothetical protein